MSPSYSVPSAMEEGPQNGPMPVKVNSDAPVAAERTAMLLPSPTATTPPEVTVTAPIHEAAVCEAVLPDEGAGRRIQRIHGTGTAARVITADVQRRAVERRGRDIAGSSRWIGAARRDAGCPDRSGRERVALERVKDAVLVDHTDKRLRLPSDDAVEQRRCRPEVGVALAAVPRESSTSPPGSGQKRAPRTLTGRRGCWGSRRLGVPVSK